MSKFRKQPVLVEANLWITNGDHPQDDTYLVVENTDNYPPFDSEGKVVRYFRSPDLDGQKECKHCGIVMHDHGWIDTLEGGHIVCPGDWIITGVKGEYYPCKPDVFVETYEPIDQEGADALGIPFPGESE